jgi:enterochelin esterase-like enzyme
MMPLTKGTTKEFSIYSDALGEDVELLVYFPASFSTLYKYNLLIAQDGRDYFQLGRVAKTIEELLQEKKIDNTIVIGIPYKNVDDRKEKYHPYGKQNQAYIRFLAHELVPFLDKEFPSYQMGMGRILMGDSLGGTVSLLSALAYPHTFGKIIMQSPYVNNLVLDQVKNFSQPHLLEIYHSIGIEETRVQTTDGQIKDFLQPNRKLHQIIIEKQFHTYYKEFEGDHTWTHWQPDLKEALEKMLKI